jgi:hypothetical protein
MARIMLFRHCPTLLSDAPGVVVALTPHRRRPAWTPGALRGWSRLGLDQTHSLEARTYLFFRWIGAQGMQRGPRASGYSDRPEGRNGVNLEAHGKSCPRGAVVSRSGSDLFSSLFRPAGHPPTRRNLAREHPDRPRPARPRVASRRASGGRQDRGLRGGPVHPRRDRRPGSRPDRRRGHPAAAPTPGGGRGLRGLIGPPPVGRLG